MTRGRKDKGASSSRSDNRFVNEIAKKRYEHLVQRNTKIIEERGFPDARSETLPGYVSHEIFRRNWREFVQTPQPGVVAIVREFYANYREADPPDHVMVRGKTVVCTDIAINDYYGLPSFNSEEDEYAEFNGNDPDMQSIIGTLCAQGTQLEGRGDARRYVLRRYVCKAGKVWNLFICSRLMPTTHLSDITKNRLILLYALLKGMTIDVGTIINWEMDYSQENDKYGLYFPSLITGLCRRAGVQWDDHEELVPQGSTISLRIMKGISAWDEQPQGGDAPPPAEPEAADPAEPQEHEGDPDPQPQPQPPPDYEQPQPTFYPAGADFQEHMAQLAAQMASLGTRMEQGFTSLHDQVHALARDQHAAELKYSKTMMCFARKLGVDPADVPWLFQQETTTQPPADAAGPSEHVPDPAGDDVAPGDDMMGE